MYALFSPLISIKQSSILHRKGCVPVCRNVGLLKTQWPRLFVLAMFTSLTACAARTGNLSLLLRPIRFDSFVICLLVHWHKLGFVHKPCVSLMIMTYCREWMCESILVVESYRLLCWYGLGYGCQVIQSRSRGCRAASSNLVHISIWAQYIFMIQSCHILWRETKKQQSSEVWNRKRHRISQYLWLSNPIKLEFQAFQPYLASADLS